MPTLNRPLVLSLVTRSWKLIWHPGSPRISCRKTKATVKGRRLSAKFTTSTTPGISCSLSDLRTSTKEIIWNKVKKYWVDPPSWDYKLARISTARGKQECESSLSLITLLKIALLRIPQQEVNKEWESIFEATLATIRVSRILHLACITLLKTKDSSLSMTLCSLPWLQPSYSHRMQQTTLERLNLKQGATCLKIKQLTAGRRRRISSINGSTRLQIQGTQLGSISKLSKSSKPLYSSIQLPSRRS